MPGMSGVEATEAIRKAESGSTTHVPIVAMTAHAMKGDRERFLAAGMDDYVSKPLRSDEVLATIAAATRGQRPTVEHRIAPGVDSDRARRRGDPGGRWAATERCSGRSSTSFSRTRLFGSPRRARRSRRATPPQSPRRPTRSSRWWDSSRRPSRSPPRASSRPLASRATSPWPPRRQQRSKARWRRSKLACAPFAWSSGSVGRNVRLQ